jgi:hypothetical protein
MTLGHHKRAVGVFPTRNEAEHALKELRDSGFPMDRVSVVARDAEGREDIAGASVHDRVGTKAEEGAGIGALTGGGLGGLTGLLVGLGALAIPGIGPVMLAGATATAIATTIAGGAIGAVTGSLVGALVGLGIPEEQARVYNERVTRGEYLVIVDGTDAELARAEAILKGRGIQEYGIYNAPNAVAAPVTATPAPVVASTEGIARNKYAIGYFPHRSDAERAIADLRSAGFPLDRVSLVAERFEQREPFAGLDLRDRLDSMRMGLPDERARLYNDRLARGDYLVVVNGTDEEVHRAASILSARGIQEWRVYDPTEVGTTHSDSTRPDEALGVAAVPADYVDPVRSDYDVMPGGSSTTAGYVAPVTTGDVVNRYDTPVVPPATTGYAAPTPMGQVSDVNLGGHKRAAGVFLYRRDAEAALTELRDSGFPMAQVSVVAKDADRAVPLAGAEMHEPTGDKAGVGGNKADEGAKGGAIAGGALGGLGGLLVGLGALTIPGVGPLVLAGAGATALATAAAGGAIGAAAGGLGGALVGAGIPEEQARVYNERVSRGEYLVMVDGTEAEIDRAEAILSQRGIQDWGVFDAPPVNRANSDRSVTDAAINTTRTDATGTGSTHPRVDIIDHRNLTT